MPATPLQISAVQLNTTLRNITQSKHNKQRRDCICGLLCFYEIVKFLKLCLIIFCNKTTAQTAMMFLLLLEY